MHLQPYKPGKSPEDIKQEYNLDEVFKLASNENVYGCSPAVKRALEDTLTHAALYPDGNATSLRQEVASHLQVNENQLLFGSGLDEVIQIISRALLTEGDNIVTADVTFPQYKHHAVIEGCEIREIPLTADGCFDLKSIGQAIDDKTRIVWICNPNNPTGTYVNKTAIMEFLQSVPKETIVILDEAYYEYVTAEDYPQTIPLLKNYKNLIILRTFSKAYGLAGFRVGYGIGNEDLIEKINICRLPFNTSSFAQAAAIAALKDQVFLKDCVEKNKREREKFEKELHQLGAAFYPSQTNFIYIQADDLTMVPSFSERRLYHPPCQQRSPDYPRYTGTKR